MPTSSTASPSTTWIPRPGSCATGSTPRARSGTASATTSSAAGAAPSARGRASTSSTEARTREIERADATSRRRSGESDTLSFGELRAHIGTLEKLGLDVTKLRVELHRKLAFPMVSLIMTLIGIPFAFVVARRGALYGVAASIVIAIVYWACSASSARSGTTRACPRCWPPGPRTSCSGRPRCTSCSRWIRSVAAPDNTAVRVALWRALHVEVDPPPHVLEDEVGLKLAAPDDGWRSRPDMSPFTRPFRASIVARARFIEDLVAEQAARGVGQYVILGAGLDTFAQRRPELASRLLVFEVDRPGPQAWKRQRLVDLGFGIPSFLRLVPVDFEAGDAWWERLAASGFDAGRPAVVASTGVSMYLTKDAIAATLRQVAALAPGSTLAMSFMLPIELADPEVRPGIERAAAGARANGTPFISFFTPTEMLTLAREAGFRDVQHVSAAALAQRYFAGRTDGLRPPNNAEELLVATT